ncbi:MAG: tripartite tricarboxylate transporter substrate-binding protein, partial [Halobacteriales archaeon]|nr:tripartite tricarboxylate transporter substrate-binding protein [Halobacteriales archaeon]
MTLGSLGLAGCLGSIGGGEGEFPSRNVTVIFGFGEGGGTHRAFESLRPAFSEALGTEFRLDFRPGAGTQIGLEGILDAEADGYTIGNATFPHGLFTELIFDAPYSIPEDFAFLGNQTNDPSAIRIPDDEERYDDLEGLVQYARENPGELDVSTSGPFSVASLAMVAIERETGAEFNFVPFDGGSSARSAVISGEVDLTFTNVYASLGIAEDSRCIGVFETENKWADVSDDAPPIYDALDISPEDVPPGSFSGAHAWATSREVEDEFPDRLETLQTAFDDAWHSDTYQNYLEDEGLELWAEYQSPDDTRQKWEDGKVFYQEWVP